MKRIAVLLISFLTVISIYSQDNTRFYGDVTIYGHIQVNGNPSYSSKDSSIFPFFFVDSISVDGFHITKQFLQSLPTNSLTAGIGIDLTGDSITIGTPSESGAGYRWMDMKGNQFGMIYDASVYNDYWYYDDDDLRFSFSDGASSNLNFYLDENGGVNPFMRLQIDDGAGNAGDFRIRNDWFFTQIRDQTNDLLSEIDFFAEPVEGGYFDMTLRGPSSELSKLTLNCPSHTDSIIFLAGTGNTVSVSPRFMLTDTRKAHLQMYDPVNAIWKGFHWDSTGMYVDNTMNIGLNLTDYHFLTKGAADALYGGGGSVGANGDIQLSDGSGGFDYDTYFNWNGYALTSIDNTYRNLIIGQDQGASKTSANDLVALGYRAGYSITSANDAVFIGSQAGYSATTSGNDVFVGYNAGYSTLGGSTNIFIGASSGYYNTTGANNVFIGHQAGEDNVTYSGNTYIGHQAGANTDNVGNTFIGYTAGLNSTGALNTIIGYSAGQSTTTSNNIYVGYQAAQNSTAGTQNIYIGRETGKSSTGSNNVLMGYQSGNALTSGGNNVFMGTLTGSDMTNSSYNTFIGDNAGGTSTTGNQNTYVGHEAGWRSSASYNTYIGNRAGYLATTGSSNTCLGEGAYYSNTTGSNNVIIGYRAGYNTTASTGNVFIGFQAGSPETGSNLLYIENSGSTSPLIWGDFTNDQVKFNGTQIESDGTIADNDATPDVSGANVWTYNGTATAIVVTDLDNPVVGAIYRIIGNSDTYTISINDGGNFNLSGNWVGGIDDVLTLYVQADNDYIEISRSDN